MAEPRARNPVLKGDATKRGESRHGRDGITGLLRAWEHGDPQAPEELLPLVYEELRRRAAAYLRHERSGHTLQPTALIHEAYLRLAGQQRVDWQNRAQFFGVAAQMMRRILVDHARGRHRKKRAADLRVTLDENFARVEPRDCDLLLLDQALGELTAIASRHGQIVEMRYFGGLTVDEVAGVLAVSSSTVEREWQTARAWLYRRMTTGRPQSLT